MLVEILNELWSRRGVRIGTYVLAGLIVLLILFNFFNQKNYKDYAPFETPFSQSQNFSYLRGSSVYSFNGLAFYKLDLDSNQTTVLQSGNRLPIPSQVVWAGDSGALLNFSGTLYDTKVDDALKNRGEKVDEATQLYTWYLDFKTGELKFVNKLPMQKNRSAYSSELNGVYYLPDQAAFARAYPDEISGVERYSVNFYDPANNTDTVVVKKIDTVDVTATFVCSGQSLCVIIVPPKDTAKTKVLGVSKTGETKVLLDNYNGRIFSTSDPNLLINVPNVADSEAGEEYFEVDADEGQALLYNLETKKEHKLGFSIGNSSPLTNFDGQHFYVFDTNQFATPGKPDQFYRTGVLSKSGKPSTKQASITLDDEEEDKSIVYFDYGSYGSVGRTLLNPIEGNMTLFGEVGKTQNISPIEVGEAKLQVEKCQTGGKPEYQYFEAARQFRIIIPQTGNWRADLAAVSTCVADKGVSAMVGYNYQFSLTDPTSGRLVSD